MLVRLLYASRAANAPSADLVDAILADARKKNLALGVTGLLCHSTDTFLQLLEGGRDAVSRLYTEIAHDARHRDVVLLDFEEIDERRFGSWTMGQVNLAKVNPSILLKYSERAVLDPYVVPGKVSLALLDELVVTASVGCKNA